MPSGGDEPVEDGTRVISGERLFVSNPASDFEPGIGIGSDISRIVCGGVRGLSWKEMRRNAEAPLNTRTSAMIPRVAWTLNREGYENLYKIDRE
jgi:hypothetical protein